MKKPNPLRIPRETLPVSEARAKLSLLLRRIRVSPRVYYITRSGKPAAALVDPDWLERIVAQANGQRPFSIFGQARAVKGWEKELKKIRKAVVDHVVERFDRLNRRNP